MTARQVRRQAATPAKTRLAAKPSSSSATTADAACTSKPRLAFTLLTHRLASAQTVMLRMKPSGYNANKVGLCSCFNHTAKHKNVKAASS